MTAIPARRLLPAVLTVFALAAAPGPAFALAGLFGRSLSGSLDVSAVQGRTDGIDSESLRQDYNLFWRRSLTPYLDFDARFRYFDYEVELQQTPGSYRKEIQPAAEISWRHPLFHLSASGLHRKTETVLRQDNIATDGYLLSFRTRESRWPVLSARYDWRHVREIGGLGRDSRDRSFQGGLNWSTGDHSLTYTFDRGSNENVVSELESTRTAHRFRWTGTMTALPRDKLLLNTAYSFGRLSQSDRAAAPGAGLEALPPAVGLFAVDPSPSLGELEPLSSLVDGNVENPSVPPVEIGGAAVDRNVGVDLGTRREVAAVYVHTSGPSGDGVLWRPYVSEDNLSWEAVAGSLSNFNPVLSRYEVTFPATGARYVKVVNSGLNEVLEVSVTEVRVFRPLGAAEGDERTQTEHMADLRAGYHLTSRLDATLDLSWRRNQGEAAPDLRNSADYSARLRYRQGGAVVHNLRWGQSFQGFAPAGEDLREDNAAYTMTYDPLPSLGSLLTASRRQTRAGAVRDLQMSGVLARLHGEPVYRLLAILEAGWTRTDQWLGGLRLDTWNYRASVDGPLTSTLNATVTYLQQETSSRTSDWHRTRRVTSLGLSYRLTRTIFFRGDLNYVDDPDQNLTEDFALSWNLTPKLTVTGQAMVNDAPGLRTSRYGAYANLELSPRTNVYFSYSRVDFTEAGGNETDSFQQGIRMGL